jgi:hypothetical protein
MFKMIWIRRILFLPGWLLLVFVLSYLSGYEGLPAASYEWGLMLAVGGAIGLLILIRFFAIAALGLSLMFALGLLLAVVVCANYFLFERERDRWYGNEAEAAQMIPIEERDRVYLRSLGIEPKYSPPLNWWAHTQAQASSGLSSQQLSPNHLGIPKPVRFEDEIWFSWLSQLMMLLTGVTGAALIGCRRKKTAD